LKRDFDSKAFLVVSESEDFHIASRTLALPFLSMKFIEILRRRHLRLKSWIKDGSILTQRRDYGVIFLLVGMWYVALFSAVALIRCLPEIYWRELLGASLINAKLSRWCPWC
jgi:hypothetical protein